MNRWTPGIVPGRLSSDELAAKFSDLHPPLDDHEAFVAAGRCYFCHDAPCTAACPTEIDIPMFIREIFSGRPEAAARTIFAQNVMGGMCARVCPTETLCEEACVRQEAEGKPVEIGRLQRYATDRLMGRGAHPFTRAEPTGRKVAVVGSGPAGLACAHRLAMAGHDVVIFEAREKPGGLNEYGIAAYKTTDGFAQAEVDWLVGIGGIEIRTGTALGRDITLDELLDMFDAVFLGMGLAGVNALGIPGEDLAGVEPAIDFIARIRQAKDLAEVPVGRNVVVIGGGMTAIDAAVQAKLLGAEHSTIVYRRGPGRMGASEYERELAAARGVTIVTNARPVRILGQDAVEEVEFEYTVETGDGRLEGTGETFRLPADQLFKAIGQKLEGVPGGVELENGKIRVDAAGRTTRERVWAGGDCVAPGEDLTVSATAQGRDAAASIHSFLMGEG